MYDRRAFLKSSAVAFWTMMPAQTRGSSGHGKDSSYKRNVDETAKEVWKLSRDAWPITYTPSGFYSAAIGVLDLLIGRYLKIKSWEIKGDSGLELTVVKGIDDQTRGEVNEYFRNCGFKYYVPRLDDVTHDEMERIQKQADEENMIITPTTAAVIAIWNKKILEYAKKNELPVLCLNSNRYSSLGSLDLVGIGRDGYEPKVSGLSQFGDFQEHNQKQIIKDIYAYLLNETIAPLREEIREKSNRFLKDEYHMKQKLYEIANRIQRFQM